MLGYCLTLLESGGDRELFREFHRRHERRLYAVALGLLRDPRRAEDAVQEAMCLTLLESGGDRELFREFHRRHERRLYAVALGLLRDPRRAEDAVQEAMVHIARHFDQFKKIFAEDCLKIGPWAVIIVKHAALDQLRRDGRLSQLPEEWDAPAPETAESEHAYRRLVELIRAMPERDREVLELRFVREWEIRDIARRLGLSETAARKRVDRARARLVAVLRKEGYEYGT